jgi:hypothetical protein
MVFTDRDMSRYKNGCVLSFLFGLIWNGSRYKIQNRCILIVLTITIALKGEGIKKNPLIYVERH